MCLTIKHDAISKIAKKDIIVYKHIIDNGNKTYKSSYQWSEIIIGDTYTSELGINYSSVQEGLHSFKLLEDAIINGKEYHEPIIECIIPKGSEYYEGTFVNKEAFVSNQLKYVKLYEEATV